MTLIIAKTETGFRVLAMPPRVKKKYVSREILSEQEVIDLLQEREVNQVDLIDVLTEADESGIGYLP